MTAFDALAPTYDHDFTQTPLGLILRYKAQARLQAQLKSGMRVLELGCGTGEDAKWIGEQGIEIVATDASAHMRAAAEAKTHHWPHVRIQALDMTQPPHDWPATPFDLVFSHFGALNCVADVRPLAAWLAARVATGGKVCFMVMSPACLWERVFYLARGRPHMAFRRTRPASFQPDPALPPMTIYYPSIDALRQAFAPHFAFVSVRPMGLFIPPSELFGLVEKRPWLKRALLALEARFGDQAAWAQWADHYTLMLQKR